MRTSLGWAPEIPDHWSVVPLNYVAKMGTGHTPDRNKPEYWEDCTIPWVSIRDAARSPESFVALSDTAQKVNRLGLANSAAVLHPRGTVMLSRTASIGYSVLIGAPMATTQDFVTWTPGPRLHSRYLLAVLRAMKPEWEKLAFGSTHRTIYFPDLEALRIPLPTLSEQRAIADFIEEEVGRVNALDRMYQRVLELSTERIDSRVRHTIGASLLASKGGGPIDLLRRLIIKLDRQVAGSSGIVTVFRDGQVVARSARRTVGFAESSGAEPAGQGVRVGDIVVHGLDGFAGAIGDSESDGNCSLAYHVCQPVNGGDSAFYGRLLQILALDGYLSAFGGSARERAVDFRNWGRFGTILVPRVAPDEQREIGDAIRALRPLRDDIGQIRKLLAERRQALITAAVTGQIDVSTASGVTV